MLSESATARMIHLWKRARLSTGTAMLGFPSENILEKAGKGRNIGVAPITDKEMTDAEKVQSVVLRMPKEVANVFEAYHLMLICGKRCRELPHKKRAEALGISYKTYSLRRDEGFRVCRQDLQPLLELFPTSV